jgi:hypothetical protein
MKRIIILSVCLLIGLCAIAQKINKADVPLNIIKIYQSKMIDSLPATWELKNDNYIAHFSKSDLNANMVISDKNEWVNTQWEIPSEYLPKKVKEYISANYAGYKTSKTRIEYKPGGEFYLVELKKKKELRVLRFSVKSEFIGVEPSTPADKKKAKPAADNKAQ